MTETAVPKSYTQWSVFKTCGAKYKYQYKDRISTGAQAPAAARGTDIHKVVENIIGGVIPGMPEEYQHLAPYEEFFLMLKERGAIAELPFVLDAQWKNSDRVGAWVRGFIDIILPNTEPDTPLYIYELKSGKVWPDHVDQRHFYGTVALSMYPTASEAHVIGTYLDLQVNEANMYPRTMLRTYHYMWKNRLDQLDKEEGWVPNPGVYCRWCPFSADKGGPCKFSGHQ